MKPIQYFINQQTVSINLSKENQFSLSEDICISNIETDPTFSQTWYQEGYHEVQLWNEGEFKELKLNIQDAIKKLMEQELKISTSNFSLEKYHHFITNDEDHFKLVRQTRDLFEHDFHFFIKEIIPKLENKLNLKLSDKNPLTGENIHIIIRLNRPFSTDYNPPHKDIYEIVDAFNMCPRMINIWIPIAGVNKQSSLPIAPEPHLLKESVINRTKLGAHFNDQQFHVRLIKDWDGQNQLIRSKVKDGEALVFSSYLIHGLALNEQMDTTIVALEFRLLN